MNVQTRLPHFIVQEPISEVLYQFLARAIQTVKKWEHNYRTRKELAKMDSYLLEDIGLTKWDVEQELNKPFWK